MFKYSGPEGQMLESEALKAGDVLAAWKLGKGAIAALVDGKPVDLDVVVDHDAAVAPVVPESDEGLDIVRHSTA
ncbi:MAG: threonine--tRNA ligase, partial [Pyramidobacter sp.]|nr:threonine--tRNA ligase [Pyramidobacter sp.]